MLRHVAPAGAPISAVDLASWLLRVGSRRDAEPTVCDFVAKRFGVHSCRLVGTGRAGMTLILRSMRAAAPVHRTEVILPSYTCYSVAASITKAGLTPHVVDVDPVTLDFDHDQLAETDFTHVLAIVATNLYGVPNDTPRLGAIARAKGMFLVDDAAQAMGARLGGRHVGTFGDAGLFSLDKGKSVSAIDGGLILCNSEAVAGAVDREVARLEPPARAEIGTFLAKLAAYSLMLRPSLYWIPNGIPQLALGKTAYRTDFPLERASAPQAALAATMLRRLHEFTDCRRRNAARLSELLRSIPGVTLVRPPSGAEPAYVRFPFLAPDTIARDRIVEALNGAGIGATASYPGSIADVPELRGQLAGNLAKAAGGRDLARRIVTLPTHPYVKDSDLRRMAEGIDAAMRARTPQLACEAPARHA